MVTRRRLMQLIAGAVPAAYFSRLQRTPLAAAALQGTGRALAAGPFQPTWDSLKQ